AKGVRTISAKAEAERGSLVAAHCVTGEEDLIVTTAGGIVTRMSVGEVRSMGRSTSGVRIQRIKGEEDHVSSCAIVPAEEDVPEDEAAAPEAGVKEAVEVPVEASDAEAEAIADATAEGEPDDDEIAPADESEDA
ncbi:MAG: gyrase subunit, partial [Actinomycetota bacterium]